MTFPPPGPQIGFPPPPLPGKRPGVVTAAAMLMVGMCVVCILIAALAMFAMFTEAAGSIDPRMPKIFALIFGFGNLVVGLGVIGLALLVLRGRNWARVVTFVAYGFFILGGSCMAFLMVVAGSESSESSGPSSGENIAAGLFVLQVLILIVTVVLLALPSANRWFGDYSRAMRAGLV